jgi:hypothetical protein
MRRYDLWAIPCIFAFVHTIREQLLILITTPLYIIIIGAEIFLSNYRHRKLYSWRDSTENVCLMLLNSGLDLAFRAVYLVILGYFYQHRLLSMTNLFPIGSCFFWLRIFYITGCTALIMRYGFSGPYILHTIPPNI